MKLNGKTILMTGGTSGIGLELARQLLARGNTVLVTGRDQERLDAAAQALPGLHPFRSDVSDLADILALHGRVLAAFPGLDTLINNAGIMRNLDLQQPRPLDDLTREIDINLSGPIQMVQQFLPQLKSRPQALIVNVSSGLAYVPFTASPIYSAAKAGLHAYTRTLRLQLEGSGVTVVELAPPGTETPLFRGEFERETRGQKAMSVQALAGAALRGIEAGQLEIRPGLSSVLNTMSRVAPKFMLRQLTNASRPKG